jgi:hypothetical protein
MAKETITPEEKVKQLELYRDLNLAALDYTLEKMDPLSKTETFDPFEHLTNLKDDVTEHFQKGRLSKLKQWFRDFTEMPLETKDFNFNRYIKNKTGHDIDIFENFRKRLEKTIEKGKITTDNQYYDVNMLINDLCQTKPVDDAKIKVLNKLISDYENKKVKK